MEIIRSLYESYYFSNWHFYFYCYSCLFGACRSSRRTRGDDST